MATGIFKRGRTWYVQFFLYGRRQRVAVSQDKREAELAAKQIDADRARAKAAGEEWSGLKGLKKRGEERTFAQVANDYIEGLAKPKASTIITYRSILDCHLLPAFGHVPVTHIKAASIRKFVSGLAEGRGPARVNQITGLMGSVLRQAVLDEEIDKNPVDLVKRIPEEKPDIEPYSEEELEAIFDAANPHYRSLFETLAYTGARQGEMKALRWSDVNWVRKEININKNRVYKAEGTPKTRTSKRKIPLTPPVEAILKGLKQKGIRSKDGYVFTDPNGQPINKHLDRVWERANRKAGVSHRSLHHLRHTFATRCIADGFPPNVIARWLGHSIQTLFQHYAGYIEAHANDYNRQLREKYSAKQEKKLRSV